jgi:hypothetical protein
VEEAAAALEQPSCDILWEIDVVFEVGCGKGSKSNSLWRAQLKTLLRKTEALLW